jgi:extracellular factor (EF) 3-hydroxypalmitic acid methyl ester biosynthesis protein
MLPTDFVAAVSALSAYLESLRSRISEATNSISTDIMDDLRTTFSLRHTEMARSLAGQPSEVWESARWHYRQVLQEVLREAAIVDHCVSRPRGYHGDFETMEMMYRNAPEGTTTLGRYIHAMLIYGRECGSVRTRRGYLTSRLVDLARERPITVSSIACGPAAELRDAFSQVGDAIRAVVLVDQDGSAIEHALGGLAPFRPAEIQVMTLQTRIQRLLPVPGRTQVLLPVQCDYIYSAGLYDYLDETTACELTSTLAGYLAPGGILEFGNFTIWPAGFVTDMVCGWRLLLRSKAELLRLVPESCAATIEPVGDQLFATIRRASDASD